MKRLVALLAVTLIGCAGIVDEFQAVTIWVVNPTGAERYVALVDTRDDPQARATARVVPPDDLAYRLYSGALGSMHAPDLSVWIFLYDAKCAGVAWTEVEPGAYWVTITTDGLDVSPLGPDVTRPPAEYLEGPTCSGENLAK